MAPTDTAAEDHFAPPTGVPTMDLARYSARPAPIEKFVRLKGGLATLEFPSQPHVQAVEAPGQGGIVILHLLEPIRTEVPVAKEFMRRTYPSGSLFVIPEGMVTRWQAEAGLPAATHVHIGQTFAGAWLEAPSLPSLGPLALPADRVLTHLLAGIHSELREPNSYQRLALQGLALAVASRLMLPAGSGQTGRQRIRTAMVPARMRRLREYVLANLSSDLCLQDLAAVVGLSPSHFGRAFKAETNMSPYAWVLELRVEQVKAALIVGGKRLSDIALDCGFSSQSHMTAVFTKIVGLPPGQWARRH